MPDITVRLRSAARSMRTLKAASMEACELEEAANEIERLREALFEISSPSQADKLLWWQKRAREALSTDL